MKAMLQPVALMVFITVMGLLFPTTVFADSGTVDNYDLIGSVPIPDNTGFNGRVNWPVAISGAPAGAVITGVDVEYWIDHTWRSDLIVYLSTDRSGTWYDQTLWNREGGSDDNIYEKESSLTKWNGLSPNGTWYLVAYDNASGDVGDIEAVHVWVHWERKPDLVAYGVSVGDTTVDPGQSVTITWTAKNQGIGSAGATQQGVMWSANSTISRTDTLREKEYLGSMGIGVTSPESHTITIPPDAIPGQTYYIGIYADYDLTETESNESNNGSIAVAVTINVPPTPDLVAYGVSVGDATVDPGQSVTITWTAKNQGIGSAGATQQGVMWSTDGAINRTDTLLEREYLGSMGIGVTSPESHTITIPSNAIPGQTYYIGIYADYDLTETESNESNNGSIAVAVTINVPPTRIIRLGGDMAFGNVIVGQAAQKTLVIYNDGNSALNVTGISRPVGFSGGWSGPIPSGGSQNVTITFAPTAAQSYGDTITVNCNNTGGTNTISASGTGVPVTPNATIVSKSVSPIPVTLGGSMGFSITIKNTGNGAWTYGVGCSVTKPNGVVDNRPLQAIALSQNGTETRSWTYTPTTTGTHTVMMAVWKKSTEPLSPGDRIVDTGWISFNVDDPPSTPTTTIALSRTSISANCTEGSNPASQFFDVKITGTGALDYTISNDVSWLSCSPTSGSSSGTVTVKFNASTLVSDYYSGTITVKAAGASMAIPVGLTVNAVPKIAVFDESTEIVSGQTSAIDLGVATFS